MHALRPPGLERGLPAILCGLVLLVAFPPAPASRAESLSAERSAIEAMLRSTIEDGHREKSVEKVLAAYSADAEIVTHIFGELPRDEYGRRLQEDFDTLAVRKVRLDLLDFDLHGDEATVLINLSVTGDLPRGLKANRHDRAWLRLRREGGHWSIRLQSYRRDFGVTDRPHDFSP